MQIVPRLALTVVFSAVVLGCGSGRSAWAQGEEPDVSGVPAAEGGTASAEGGAERDLNPFVARFSADEPLYFAIGWREDLNAKFQLSFKYAFMNPRGGISRKAPFFSHVYLGYTQTSLWDLESDSKPFFDTTYRPSLFYKGRSKPLSSDGSRTVWTQMGVEHESNGQAGEESRALNLIYLKARFSFDGVLDGGHFWIEPKVWAYLGDLEDNPDIADYRGYGDLRMAFTGRADWQIAGTFSVGTSGKASVQLEFTYPTNRLFSKSFDAFLYAQYFNGWGESLLTYNQRLPWQLRIGLSVVR